MPEALPWGLARASAQELNFRAQQSSCDASNSRFGRKQLDYEGCCGCCVRAGDDAVLPGVEAFLQEQGRMK
jgi:hypothetical protein